MASLLLGIDAGGTATVARAASNGAVVFEGRSGPGNALSTPADLLEHHLSNATAGCPTPDRIAGCFAGLATPAARSAICKILSRLFPGALLRLAPDYVAVILAAQPADLVVIAGTGSVCCTYTRGKIATSGGLGYLLGDEGSGFRYGRALVKFALSEEPSRLPGTIRAALTAEFGSVERREIVRRVHTAAEPAALLARFAVVLGQAADAGERWASDLADGEAGQLARTAARHLRSNVPFPTANVALAGGVWTSNSIRSAFARHLRTLLPGQLLDIQPLGVAPVAGAIRLAALDDDSFASLVDQGRAVGGGPSGD